MLVQAQNILKKAKNEGYAIPQFNINNLEWTRFILEACEEKKSPVILGVSESAVNYMGGYKVVVHIVEDLIAYLNITIPVVLHLDHGKNIDSCKAAIDAGFSSVMIDASKEELTENIRITKKVIEYAKKYNVSVEGELGYIGTTDASATPPLKDILQYVNETSVDALAVALGNIHGIYKSEPKLDFEKMEEIQEKTSVPIVLHGGSGIDDEKIRKAVSLGITKLNINTDLQIAWANAVRKYINETEEYDPRKIIKSGEQAIKDIVYQKIELLGSSKA